MSGKSSVVSFRLNDEEITKLDTVRGDKTISSYCKDFILTHINDTSTPVNIELLNLELKHKNELLDSVNNRVHDLENTNGFLISQITALNKVNDRLLMPSQEEQKEKGKKWFEFWK
jgi:hypothetical protein